MTHLLFKNYRPDDKNENDEDENVAEVEEEDEGEAGTRRSRRRREMDDHNSYFNGRHTMTPEQSALAVRLQGEIDQLNAAGTTTERLSDIFEQSKKLQKLNTSMAKSLQALPAVGELVEALAGKAAELKEAIDEILPAVKQISKVVSTCGPALAKLEEKSGKIKLHLDGMTEMVSTENSLLFFSFFLTNHMKS